MKRTSPRLKGGDYWGLSSIACPVQRDLSVVFMVLHLCTVRFVRRCA